MQNNLIEKENPITKRTVVLLDGRRVTIPLYQNFKIDNHDDLSFTLHLDIFNNNNPLHTALSNLVIDMLSVHSITYTATTTRALKKWFESKVSLETSLGIESLDSLNNVNTSYQPFLTPLLRKLSIYFEDLVSKDLIDFLQNVEKWEDRNPTYFKRKRPLNTPYEFIL